MTEFTSEGHKNDRRGHLEWPTRTPGPGLSGERRAADDEGRYYRESVVNT